MPAITDRLTAAVRAIVLSILEEKFYGLYPYVVDQFDEGAQTVSGRPLRSSSRLPSVGGVPLRTARQRLVLRKGEQFVVGFEGGDPSYPFVASYDYGAAYAGALPIARQGDLAMLGGNGFLVTFYPTGAPPTPPVVPLGVPVFCSFGSVTSPPTPPPLQSPGYAVICTGSIEAKSR